MSKLMLIDNHHGELTHSLELLFAKRLGYKVVYPIGFDWSEKGYWKVFPHPATAVQYLSLDRCDRSVYSKKEVITGAGLEAPDKDLYYCWDKTKEVYQRAITFDSFLKRDIDIVIASMPAHSEPFQELIRKYKPAAKLIFQLGNSFSGFHFKGIKNALNSTNRRLPFWIHSVKYSQEFDLKIFNYTPPLYQRLMVNLTHYMPDPGYCKAVMRFLPDHSFESYGAGNETGTIPRSSDVALKMKEADFIWHLKKGGDGYGHVVHNAAALGRPLIISKTHYGGLRFGKFIEDGKTCINVDGLSAENLAEKIRYYSEPERLEKMSKSLHERFRNLVSFDHDQKNVTKFLRGLR